MLCKFEGLKENNVRAGRELDECTLPFTSFFSWGTKTEENWFVLDPKATLGVDLRLDFRSCDP